MIAGNNVASQNGQTHPALTRTDIMMSMAKYFPNERDRERFANILNKQAEVPSRPGMPPKTRNALQPFDRTDQQPLIMPARIRPFTSAHSNVANRRDNGTSQPECGIIVDMHLVTGTQRQNQTTVPAQPIVDSNQCRGNRNDTERSPQREHNRPPVAASNVVTNDFARNQIRLPTNEAIQTSRVDIPLEYNIDGDDRRDSFAHTDVSSRSQLLMGRSKAERDEESWCSAPIVPKRLPVSRSKAEVDGETWRSEPVPPKPVAVCQFCFLNIHDDGYASCDNRQHVFCRRCVTRYVQAFVKSNSRPPHPSGLLSCLSGSCVGPGSVLSHEMIHRMCDPILQEAYQEKLFEVMFMMREPSTQGTASVDSRAEQGLKRVAF